jgi:hypothetical protein
MFMRSHLSSRAWLVIGVLVGSMAMGDSARAEGWAWPNMFGKKNSSGEVVNTNPTKAWFNQKMPTASPVPSQRASAPRPQKMRWQAPPLVSSVGNGTKWVYNHSVGMVIPRRTPEPMSVTGSNTPWSRPRSTQSQASTAGFGSWFGRSEPKEPQTMRDSPNRRFSSNS